MSAQSTHRGLVLPFPMPLERMHGALSLQASGMPISVRLHKDDLDVLRCEAQVIGVSPSALVRWFTVYGAQQLAFVRTGHSPVVRP